MKPDGPDGNEKLIDTISDTAQWIAFYRAVETERPDALFRDPYARQLAGEKGPKIAKYFDKRGTHSWALAVRTHLLDELILEAVNHQGVDTVLNLACGLDTRAYRLALPPSLRWIEVDLPDLLQYKRGILKDAVPVCHFEQVSLDLSQVGARREFFEKVDRASKKVLVVTEGLLIYLTEQDNRALAEDLAAQPTFQLWLMDIYSGVALRLISKEWERKLSAANARMQFAPSRGTGFFRPSGWEELRFMSLLEEGVRVNRKPPGAPLWKLVLRLIPEKFRLITKRISGIALLHRAS